MKKMYQSYNSFWNEKSWQLSQAASPLGKCNGVWLS
jgi:hypothetical protein